MDSVKTRVTWKELSSTAMFHPTCLRRDVRRTDRRPGVVLPVPAIDARKVCPLRRGRHVGRPLLFEGAESQSRANPNPAVALPHERATSSVASLPSFTGASLPAGGKRSQYCPYAANRRGSVCRPYLRPSNSLQS